MIPFISVSTQKMINQFPVVLDRSEMPTQISENPLRRLKSQESVESHERKQEFIWVGLQIFSNLMKPGTSKKVNIIRILKNYRRITIPLTAYINYLILTT